MELDLRFNNNVQVTSTMLTLSPPAPLTWTWSSGNTRLRLAPTDGTFWASVVNALSITPDAGLFNCAQQSNYTSFRCNTGTMARGTTKAAFDRPTLAVQYEYP